MNTILLKLRREIVYVVFPQIYPFLVQLSHLMRSRTPVAPMTTRFLFVSSLLLLTCSWVSFAARESTEPCAADGEGCIPGGCCPDSTCAPVPLSRTGICTKSGPGCSLTGDKCNEKVECCSVRDECIIKGKGTGTGICTTQICAPRGGKCLTRTPSYTGPSFPCCNLKDACLFPKPSTSGICLPKSSDTTCVQKGAQCSTMVGKPCCKRLKCDVVLLGNGFCR